jgi:hypothetical protein
MNTFERKAGLMRGLKEFARGGMAKDLKSKLRPEPPEDEMAGEDEELPEEALGAERPAEESPAGPEAMSDEDLERLAEMVKAKLAE